MTPALAELLERLRRFLYLPDPGIVLVALATVMANRLSGDPMWLLLVGPPGSGKTEVIDAMGDLHDVHPVSTFTEAGLISGSAVRGDDTQATGGLLVELGEAGILAFKDFTSVLSEHGTTRSHLFACLREVYDGRYVRRLGTRGGQTFCWEGEAGLIGAVTEAIDVLDLGLLGERFLHYRLPPLDDADILALGLAAVRNVGRQRTMRIELAESVAKYLGALALPDAVPPLDEDDEDNLVLLADLAVRCRSTVVRDSRDREVDLVPTSERPTRLLAQLAQLLGGLRVIDADEKEAWRLVTQVALDAMHSGRRRVLDVLVGTDLPMATAAVAGRARLPEPAARRHLEDLDAHGVVDLVGSGPNRWKASAWCSQRWGEAEDIATARGTEVVL